MKRCLSLCALACFVFQVIPAQGPHMIICTLKPYPTQETQKMAAGKSDALVAGIYGSYFGYLATSDETGQIRFPRKHNDSEFFILVTETVEPIFMVENTINTWRVPEKSPYLYYSVVRKKDTSSGLYFWDVQEAQLPLDRALPLNVIMIIADPKNCVMSVGISITNDNAQLALPPLYVKHTSEKSVGVLAMVSVRQFFTPITWDAKTQGLDIQTKMTKNNA